MKTVIICVCVHMGGILKFTLLPQNNLFLISHFEPVYFFFCWGNILGGFEGCHLISKINHRRFVERS